MKAATCPNCGAAIKLDDRLERGICEHCDSVIIIDDAIQKYKIEVSGKVDLVNLTSAENDVQYGEICIKAKDWKNGLGAFQKAIEKDTANFRAWLGCLKAITHNFAELNENLGATRGVYGYESIVNNCLHLADEAQRQDVARKLEALIEQTKKSEQLVFDNKLDSMRNAYQKYKKKLNMYLLFASAAFFLFIIFLCSKLYALAIFCVALFFMFTSFYSKEKLNRSVRKDATPPRNRKLLDIVSNIEHMIADAEK